MYIGKLFDQYDVNFPIERDFTIIVGENGSGKTQTLLKIKEYLELKNENVVYFPADRILNVTHDDALNCEMMLHLLNGQGPFAKYNIDLDMLKFDLHVQHKQYIYSGFVQIVNFYCNIMKSGQDPIVLIDIPERSLHIAILHDFIKDLLNFCKPKKLIIVTHNPEIISDHLNSITEISRCVNINEKVV